MVWLSLHGIEAWRRSRKTTYPNLNYNPNPIPNPNRNPNKWGGAIWAWPR